MARMFFVFKEKVWVGYLKLIVFMVKHFTEDTIVGLGCTVYA